MWFPGDNRNHTLIRLFEARIIIDVGVSSGFFDVRVCDFIVEWQCFQCVEQWYVCFFPSTRQCPAGTAFLEDNIPGYENTLITDILDFVVPISGCITQ